MSRFFMFPTWASVLEHVRAGGELYYQGAMMTKPRFVKSRAGKRSVRCASLSDGAHDPPCSFTLYAGRLAQVSRKVPS